MSHASVLVAVDCDESGIEDAVTKQMEPFDENGTCFRNGSRWDYWLIGGRYAGRLMGKNFMRRSELCLDAMLRERQIERRAWYAEAMREHPNTRAVIYELSPDETEDSYVAKAYPLTAYAFLRNRRWNEHERLGWFGCSTSTECERAGKERKRCLCRDKKTGAAIISWGGDVRWNEKFYDRFVRDLDSQTWLVMVDYHV